MGRIIVKPERDRNLYVEWSSIVDSPTRWGSRVEMLGMMDREDGGTHAENLKHLDRADERGTSAHGRAGGWDDNGFIVQNVGPGRGGWLPRERLAAFMDSYDEEANTFDRTLLDPFEDEGED